MMDARTKVLVVAVRKLLIEFVATLEDYLGLPYDQSALYKRRQRNKELTNGG
jgi:hypothetical protein